MEPPLDQFKAALTQETRRMGDDGVGHGVMVLRMHRQIDCCFDLTSRRQEMGGLGAKCDQLLRRPLLLESMPEKTLEQGVIGVGHRSSVMPLNKVAPLIECL